MTKLSVSQETQQLVLLLISILLFSGASSQQRKMASKANSILQGCYPDPSITRKGNDYYLVNSSFSMFPGVPIFHSNDLVNWKQIGQVLDRPSQLKVERAGISAGIYVPAIEYNPHNDICYMNTTQIAGGIGNMVVKTKDPAQEWSDPSKLQFEGIDLSLFFDANKN